MDLVREYKFMNYRKPRNNGKALVLDLDSTLIATADNFEDLHDINIYNDNKYLPIRNRIYASKVFSDSSGDKINLWGMERNDTMDFIKYVNDHFMFVAVWTAAESDYANEICKTVFRDTTMPEVIWSRKMCEKDGNNYIKPLDKMIDHYKNRGLTRSNTLIVDDTETTFMYNKENAIHIPAYNINLESLDTNDDCLLRLMNFFNTSKFINCTDVRTLNTRKIFSI